MAAAQAVTFLITDLAGIAIEMKWHKMDFLRFMPTRPWRIMFFLGWLQLLGNIRSAHHLHPAHLHSCVPGLADCPDTHAPFTTACPHCQNGVGLQHTLHTCGTAAMNVRAKCIVRNDARGFRLLTTASQSRLFITSMNGCHRFRHFKIRMHIASLNVANQIDNF